MQYEAIILELMARIKKLEDDVSALKENIGDISGSNIHPAVSSETDKQSETHRGQNSYKKMTDKMVVVCYKCGKRLAEGDNPSELADMIVEETGMNRNSAMMYIYAVSSLLSGTVFKRAISGKALRKYYDLIWNEYGSAGLKKAIHATRLHIDYRKDCGLTADAIKELCDEYETKL